MICRTIGIREGRGVSKGDVLARLQGSFQDAGRMVAAALEPLEEAIREIDVPFRASHYAEDCRDWGNPEHATRQAHAGRFAFAVECTGDRATEYCLCSARGEDGQCGLYVSVCEYHEEPGSPDAGPRTVIDRIYLTRPETLSLWLRVQILDELSQGNFLRTYRAYLDENPDPPPEGGVCRYWLPGAES
jgi:hypothetical protein